VSSRLRVLASHQDGLPVVWLDLPSGSLPLEAREQRLLEAALKLCRVRAELLANRHNEARQDERDGLAGVPGYELRVTGAPASLVLMLDEAADLT
jgi:hypothetical protein